MKIAGSWLLLAGLLAAVARANQAPVVRPTVFVNTNSSSNNAATSSAAPLVQQQQQQQQQQPLAQQQQAEAQISAQSSQQGASMMQMQQATMQTSAASNQATRISPMKSRFCQAINAGNRLDNALGMQSYQIDDAALSASSSSNEQVGPQLARLNLDLAGGAWCPSKPISMPTLGREWIQVKLNRSFVVTAVETQGRLAMGSGKEFAPSYQIEYSRDAGRTWHRWRDFRGANTLRANDDVNSVVRNELSPPIVGANLIRLLPYSAHLRTVCMRFELYGCQYDEGAPIAYATSEGVNEPRWGHLMDYTFDGWRRNGLLSNGLGQLVDGVKGADNFSHNSGFEWVGWKSMNGDVVIEFTFKTLRNFTGALFHSNNLFSSGVEVFQAVDVHYGIDLELAMEPLRDALLEQQRRAPGAISRNAREDPSGAGNSLELNNNNNNGEPKPATMWSSDVMSIEYEPDKRLEASRPVTVHLKQRLANKLRFVLKFASKWILVSEVEFLSHPVELLSLASLDALKSPPLMSALSSSARTYDEFVAILREHQLRRIAASSFLEHNAPTMLETSAEAALNGPDQSSPEQQADSFGSSSQAPEDSASDLPENSAGDGPASNPILSQPTLMQTAPFYPSIEQLNRNAPVASLQQPSSANHNRVQNSPVLSQHTPATTTTSTQTKQTNSAMGLSTVISMVLIGILVLATISFLGARLYYCVSMDEAKFRASALHQARRFTGSPAAGHSVVIGGVSSAGATLHHTQQLPRHLCGGGGGGSSGGSISESNKSSTEPSDFINNQYKSLFANTCSTTTRPMLRNRDEGVVRGTLKRLAALTSGGSDAKQQQQQQHCSNTMFHGTHQQPAHQLLVSLKDNHQVIQQPKTQLIVGLNQSNPLAQQQIYNNCGSSSNQTYTSHCSATSVSMTSAQSGRNVMAALQTAQRTGDYDYATPDNTSNYIAFNRVAPNQQQQQYNPVFANNNGYRTADLRASHRQANGMMQQHTLLRSHPPSQIRLEHNYELIHSADNQQQRPFLHNRLNSDDAALFNSMTLGQPEVGQQQQQQQQPIAPLRHNARQIDLDNNADPLGSLGRNAAETPSQHYYTSATTTTDCG